MHFSNLQVTSAIWENYVRHVDKLMKENLETETSIEYMVAVDPYTP
jgi:hypothetical protein